MTRTEELTVKLIEGVQDDRVHRRPVVGEFSGPGDDDGAGFARHRRDLGVVG